MREIPLNTTLDYQKQRSMNLILRNHQMYTMVNIDRCKFKGLYAIWYYRRCLYVGQSKKQTVYDRLYQHLSECHNDDLKLWIDVYKERLMFTTVVFPINIQDLIDQSEVYLIHSLEPETNKQHKRGNNDA